VSHNGFDEFELGELFERTQGRTDPDDALSVPRHSKLCRSEAPHMVNDRERRRIYRDTQRPRCCALLKLPFAVQCSRRASVERDGQFYCGRHDPRRPHWRTTQQNAQSSPEKSGSQ
jgi:hypothetical protein